MDIRIGDEETFLPLLAVQTEITLYCPILAWLLWLCIVLSVRIRVHLTTRLSAI